MNFEEIVQNIISKSGLTLEEVQKSILDKQLELSNLVSKEGAAYIIAKEMGLDMLPKTERRLEIKNVVPMIRDLRLTGRIMRIFDVREFDNKGKKGKVCSIVLGDSTGTIRLTLWDDQTEIIEKLKPGMAVETFGAYTKPVDGGGAEIRLGKKGGIRILENSDIPEIDKLERAPQSQIQRRDIANLKEGETSEVKASIIQLFENKMFFEVCSICGKRITKTESGYKCELHGDTKPRKSVLLLGVIDDGTANMRAVFFGENALTILDMKLDDVLQKGSEIFSEVDILGKEFVMMGRVRNNTTFERMEFVATHVREIDPIYEANRLLNYLTRNV